ncbi:MAG: virulence factor [Desulfosporosinus sp.]|nr:virulence factor [Desulfosporosinus sp.]
MSNDSFVYSFNVIGIERKQIASIIAEALSGEVSYAGAPSFGYHIAGWVIDREGIVTTPKIQNESLRTVLDTLKTAGATAEGNGAVTLSIEGHTGNTLRNVVNLIWTKQSLIQKALGWVTNIVPAGLVKAINAVPIDTLEEFAEVINEAIDAGKIEGESELEFDLADRIVSFSFFNASLDADEVLSFATLCQKLSEQAKQQKFSSIKQKETPNECYSMRCFLLKLGFIGKEYKIERKILLSKLDGNSAFRTPEAKQAAEAKRKPCTPEAPIEGSVGE